MTETPTTQHPNDLIAIATYFMSHTLHSCLQAFDPKNEHSHLQFNMMPSNHTISILATSTKYLIKFNFLALALRKEFQQLSSSKILN